MSVYLNPLHAQTHHIDWLNIFSITRRLPYVQLSSCKCRYEEKDDVNVVKLLKTVVVETSEDSISLYKSTI